MLKITTEKMTSLKYKLEPISYKKNSLLQNSCATSCTPKNLYRRKKSHHVTNTFLALFRI